MSRLWRSSGLFLSEDMYATPSNFMKQAQILDEMVNLDFSLGMETRLQVCATIILRRQSSAILAQTSAGSCGKARWRQLSPSESSRLFRASRSGSKASYAKAEASMTSRTDEDSIPSAHATWYALASPSRSECWHSPEHLA
ncbi:hypothetical protein CSOJ01_11039 [Colletotrichum sojae]|uniref:Uncharacterized protein n=1 Tax=Colletotrichum sojae TaxID=2175907 RepID=A0A8H6MNL8_9PEZI|nr:hypothetical protein CSOJ01_11039 [Colletotrichum sojae]